MKEATKTKFKFVFSSSPAIAALFMFPKETLAFFILLKDAGFEAGTISVIIGIAWWLRKDTHKVASGLREGLSETNSVFKTFTEAYAATREEDAKSRKLVEARFIEGDKKFNDLGQKILEIDTRLQGIVPKISSNELKDLAEKVSNEESTRRDLTP